MSILCRCYHRCVRFVAPFALLLAAAYSCAPEPAPPATDSSTPPPNIVVLMADDLGMADLSFLGGTPKTPVIDQLAADGIRLSNFHAFPVCSPSRAAFLTGRSPLRYGLAWSPLPPWSQRGLPTKEITIAERLREAGYRTALIGKWHLGNSAAEQHPHQHGFDHFYGCLTGSVSYWDRIPRAGGIDWQRNGKTDPQPGYTTHLIGAEADSLIRDHDFGKPLFLFVSFTAPHQPLEAPKESLQPYTGVADVARRRFCAMVSEMDRAIGQVQTALEQRGQLDNTLLIFVSDNGGARDAGGDNQPYRSGKGSVFEGGVKVPAVIRWPSKLAGGEFAEFTTIMDLAPTFYSAARLEAGPELDGRNLLPSLTAEADPSHPALPAPPAVFVAVNSSRSQMTLIESGYKYIRRINRSDHSVKEWLYYLPDDPIEKQNLIHTDDHRAGRMRDHLGEWLALDPNGGALDKIPAQKEEEPADWQAPEDWSQH